LLEDMMAQLYPIEVVLRLLALISLTNQVPILTKSYKYWFANICNLHMTFFTLYLHGRISFLQIIVIQFFKEYL
jgi:hypothetical protein